METLRITDELREIALGEHPGQDDRGVPLGIAGRRAGTGQVGAGVVRAPLGCVTAALEALAAGRAVGGG